MSRELFASVTITKRTVLLSLVVGTVVLGAGLGLLGPGPDDSTRPEATGEATPTPTPPPVSVTPSTPAETPQTADTPQATTSPESGTNAPPETTRSTPRNDDDDDGEADTELSETHLTMSVTDPENVRTETGEVGSVAGEVDARVTWDGGVDAVVLVVRAKQPDGTWAELARGTSVARGDSVSLSDAVGKDSYTFVRESATESLENPTSASRVTRTGAVAVSAVFLENGIEVDRVRQVAEYEFAVINTGTIDLRVGNETNRRLSVDGIAPGQSIERRLAVTNGGTASGTLRLSVENRSASEGGIAEPERAVDRPGVVELREHLRVRLAVTDPDSSSNARTYLVGGPDRFVTFDDVSNDLGTVEMEGDERLAVVAEWRVPTDTGNAVMTDEVSFDLSFTFTSRVDE